MINIIYANAYCKEDISLIENYEQAVSDNEVWDCHHRDEIRTLPSGITVIRTRQDLLDDGRYFHCPANELIFLTRSNHNKLHKTGNKYTVGCKLSEETRNNISNSSIRTEFGRKFKEHYGLTKRDNPKLYSDESYYYKKHNKCSWG